MPHTQHSLTVSYLQMQQQHSNLSVYNNPMFESQQHQQQQQQQMQYSSGDGQQQQYPQQQHSITQFQDHSMNGVGQTQPVQSQQMMMNGGGGGGNVAQLVSSGASGEEQQVIPMCIRTGCTNPAVSNADWEDEYCSNECVIMHCRWARHSGG